MSIEHRNYLAREKGFNSHKEYLDHLAKEKGFNNYYAYIDHRIKEKGFKNRTEYYDHLSQQRGFNNSNEEYLTKKGFKNHKEYQTYLFKTKTGHDYIDSKTLLNNWARDKGFADYKEYIDIISIAKGLPGIPNIISDNRNDRSFTGHIAEYGISRIFKNITGTFFTNPGYDFICEGLKLDVKSAILRINSSFAFQIGRNYIADRFVLVALDNSLSLNPLHLWIIKGAEPILGIPLNNRDALMIPNDKNSLTNFQKYEKQNRLDDLKDIFAKYNKDSGIYDETITKANILRNLDITPDLDTCDIINLIKEKQMKNRYSSRITIYPAEECNR